MARKARDMDKIRREQQATGRSKGDAQPPKDAGVPELSDRRESTDASKREFERQSANLSKDQQEQPRTSAEEPWFSPGQAAREHGIDPDEHNARVAAEREFDRQSNQMSGEGATHDRPAGPSFGGDPMSREPREPEGDTTELLQRMVTALEQMAEDVSFLREDIDRITEGF